MAKLRLGSKEDIRLAIRRRGSQIAAKMTDKEIFGSEEFKNYITKLLDFILRKFKLYSLTLIHDESENGFTAFTDGKNITINTGNSLVRKPKLLERRFKVVMGMGFHEAAHKLFLDFTTHNKAMDQIQGGKLYGKFHTNGEPDLEKAREELEKVTASPYSSAIASIYANLSNIIADAHDENAMKKCYPGFVTECIETLGNVIMDQCLTLEEMVGKRWDAYSILCNLMLTYAKYGYCKEGTASPETEKYMDALRAMEPTIDEAVMTDSLKARYDQLNLLVLQLWPYIRDRFPDDPQEQEQDGQGQGSSGGGGSSSGSQSQSQGSGGSPSPEEVQKQLEEAAEAANEAAGANPAPENCKGKAVDPSEIQGGGMNVGSDGDISNIAQNLAEAEATKQIQKELDDAQMEAIRNLNLPLVHKEIPVRVKRHCPQNKTEYMRISREVETYTRNMIDQIRKLFEEMNSEYLMRHKRFGPIIEATEAYRPDGAFFAKKKLPADMPDMALTILIDESGSSATRS